MPGNATAVDSATQTSDVESDGEPVTLPGLPDECPRIVIDTSRPFQSVEEAVIRFGGRGFWIPGSILADATDNATLQHETEASGSKKVGQITLAMFKDLQLKEKETDDLVKELELTKRLVEELKLKLSTECPEFRSVPCLHFDKDSKRDSVDAVINQICKPQEHSDRCATFATKLIMSELGAIRATVESLSMKMVKEKSPVDKDGDPHLQNPKILGICRELRELNYEAEQFMKTAEEAKSEVMKAMSEIEQTKSSLKVVEMRWLTAKKLEEAARATASLAIAEMRAWSNDAENIAENPGKISLSFEEYAALTYKARKAERFTRRDSRLLDSNEFEFMRNGSRPSARPKTSIGDILSKKLASRDDLEGGGVGRQRVSLNQMLSRHRGETAPQIRRERNGNESNSKRKAFGLVHISLPMSKLGKNKIQALNHW